MLFRKCFGTGDDDSIRSVSKRGNKKSVKIAEYHNRELSGLNNDEDLIENSGCDGDDDKDVSKSKTDKNTTTTKLSTDPFQNIKENALLEIVGASGLASIKNDIDTFCVVKVDNQNKVVHKTKVIPNDPNPIWTVKTESLCLLNLSPTQKVTIELYYQDSGGVVGMVGSSKTLCCGSITLSCRQLLEGNGQRKEFCPSPTQYPEISLEIRSRRAQRQDFLFFHQKKTGYWGSPSNSTSDSPVNNSTNGRPGLTGTTPSSATDTDFQMVSTKGGMGNMLFKPSKKNITVGENKEKQIAYRVWPFPNPDSPQDTEYMTKEQLHDVALQPSKVWVEAGSGDYGQVYLEILGCDSLPNMDTELVDGKTDAFIACVFEGKFVRSSVVHDSLNPRWVPWSSRAFKFNIMHPSSILFLGVFDYDAGILEAHDPIGRVVIHLDKFETGTVYTLKYPLIDSETGGEASGSITVRLRIHWNDEAEVAKAQTFVKPPRFMINTKTDQGLQILQYITGRHISEVTTQSVKLYVNELITYWRKYCYLGDVLFSIWLWRGRTTVFGKSVWFPIDSMILFFALVFAVERPEFIPSIVLYSIAYALLANNYYLSRQPNPWLRVRKFRTTFATKNLGMNASSHIRIEPETGVKEARTLQLLDEYRMNRATGFLYEFIMTGLNVYRVYSKTSPVDLSTEVKKGVGVGTFFSSFYSNYLGYLHLIFRMMCKYIRLLRNFVNWNGLGTYKFTANLLVLATAWAFFPSKHFAIWPIRVFVWITFGPWVKLLDTFWIHEYYRTKEDLLRDGIPETTEEMKEDIAKRPNILDPILKSAWFHKTTLSGRIVVEENLKLQAFRELMFGKYTELVPAIDTSRYPSVPDSSSFAQPYGDGTGSRKGDYLDISPKDKKWSHALGQKLTGEMIPVQISEDDQFS